MIPGQDFFLCSGPVCVKSRVKAAVPECFHPQIIAEGFIPPVQNASLFKSAPQHTAHSSVTPGKTGFEETDIRLMPVESHAFDIEHLSQMLLLCDNRIQRILGSPLEGRKGLGDKYAYAHCHPQPLGSLCLGDIKVFGNDFPGQVRDTVQIFCGFRRQAGHEIHHACAAFLLPAQK